MRKPGLCGLLLILAAGQAHAASGDVPVGRYSVVAPVPRSDQSDPLETIVRLTFPPYVKDVGGAVDYLLARSLTLATRTGKPEVVHAIAAITEDMAQGELRQLVYKGDLTLTEEAYREVIRSKTAVLFQAACRVGALIADAPSSQVQAIGEYGFELGMAFQMADDLLDYLQDTSVLGKTMGADLREGKLTLPVIHALQHVVGEQKQWMSDLIQKRSFSTVEFQRLIELLQSRGSIDYTRQCAGSHVMAAKSALNAFRPSSMRSLLQDVAEYAAARAM